MSGREPEVRVTVGDELAALDGDDTVHIGRAQRRPVALVSDHVSDDDLSLVRGTVAEERHPVGVHGLVGRRVDAGRHVFDEAHAVPAHVVDCDLVAKGVVRRCSSEPFDVFENGPGCLVAKRNAAVVVVAFVKRHVLDQVLLGTATDVEPLARVSLGSLERHVTWTVAETKDTQSRFAPEHLIVRDEILPRRELDERPGVEILVEFRVDSRIPVRVHPQIVDSVDHPVERDPVSRCLSSSRAGHPRRHARDCASKFEERATVVVRLPPGRTTRKIAIVSCIIS